MKRPLTWAAGLILFCAAGYLAAMHFVMPRHVKHVKGRADIQAPHCFYCHKPVTAPPRADKLAITRDCSPMDMAASPDGSRLYVACQGVRQIRVLSLPEGIVEARVDLPGEPHGLDLSPDGEWLAVSLRHLGKAVIYRACTLEKVKEWEVGHELTGVAFSRDSSRLFLTDPTLDLVWSLGLEEDGPASSLSGGHQPYALDLSKDGRFLWIANRLADPAPPNVAPSSELTLIDSGRFRILKRFRLESGHLSEGIVMSSGNEFALAPFIGVRNLPPITQVARGALMNSAVAFVSMASSRLVKFPLDEVHRAYADPADIALTPDDRWAFIAHAGARTVTVVDVQAMKRIAEECSETDVKEWSNDMGAFRHYVRTRIETLDAPQFLTLAPDGKTLYAAERLSESIAVIDVSKMEIRRRFHLGDGAPETSRRRGERLFNDASITFQGQFSCRSCHPDGHTDGLIWDFGIDGAGRNLLVTRSLRGVKDTAPFKWNGKNPSLAVQCGPRFSKVLTRSDPFSPSQLKDLVAFIESIPLPARAPVAGRDARRDRGEALFHRTRTNDGRAIPLARQCGSCHRPPLYTDRLPADVGTLGPFDSKGSFDTPHLLDVGAHPPFLHDGRALTLEEIWTVFNSEDTHGMTNDMTKQQLNDLIYFLKSL